MPGPRGHRRRGRRRFVGKAAGHRLFRLPQARFGGCPVPQVAGGPGFRRRPRRVPGAPQRVARGG
eukprot:2348452-Lingulodinium_polyedra.AAC.1